MTARAATFDAATTERLRVMLRCRLASTHARQAADAHAAAKDLADKVEALRGRVDEIRAYDPGPGAVYDGLLRGYVQQFANAYDALVGHATWEASRNTTRGARTALAEGTPCFWATATLEDVSRLEFVSLALATWPELRAYGPTAWAEFDVSARRSSARRGTKEWKALVATWSDAIKKAGGRRLVKSARSLP